MKFNNCLFFTFILFVVLLLVNNVHSDATTTTTTSSTAEPKIVGGLFEKEYNATLDLVTKVGILGEFEFIGKEVYDFCNKKLAYFGCSNNTVRSIALEEVQDDYESLNDDDFSKFENLDLVELSNFDAENEILQIPTTSLKLVQCVLDGHILEPNQKMKTLFIDLHTENGKDVVIKFDKFDNIKDFTLTSSFPINSAISYEAFEGKDEGSVNSINWDIISTDAPIFNGRFEIVNLKLTILKTIIKEENLYYPKITNLLLIKKSDDVEPINFPEKLFSKLTRFGTTFRFKHQDKPIDLTNAKDLVKLEIINAEGFIANLTDPVFPFSKFPPKFEELIYTDNNNSVPFPDLEDIFSKSPKINIINLSNNNMNGSATNIKIPNLSKLNLSNNNLTGQVGNWACKVNKNGLILKNNNNLRGSLPKCIPCFSTEKSITTNILDGNYFKRDSTICDLDLIFSSIVFNSTYDEQKNKTTYTLKGNGLNGFKSDIQFNWVTVSNNTFYKAEEDGKAQYTIISITINGETVKYSNESNPNPIIDSIYATNINDQYLNIQVNGGFFSFNQSEIKANWGYKSDAKKNSEPLECFVLPYPTKSIVNLKCPYSPDPTNNKETPGLLLTIKQKSIEKSFTIGAETITCAEDCSKRGNGSICIPSNGLCSCYHDCYYSKIQSESHGTCNYTVPTALVCNCNLGWEGNTCEVANCKTINPCANGKCDEKTSKKCICNPGWSGDSCDVHIEGTVNDGSPYTIFFVLLFIILIGLSIFGYKKYLASNSNSSDSGSSIKFKTLNSNRNVNDDEEDNLPIRKTFEDDE